MNLPRKFPFPFYGPLSTPSDYLPKLVRSLDEMYELLAGNASQGGRLSGAPSGPSSETYRFTIPNLIGYGDGWRQDVGAITTLFWVYEASPFPDSSADTGRDSTVPLKWALPTPAAGPALGFGRYYMKTSSHSQWALMTPMSQDLRNIEVRSVTGELLSLEPDTQLTFTGQITYKRGGKR